MPWEVHIERKPDPHDDKGIPILEAELRVLEASDPELRSGPDEDMNGVNPKTGAKIHIPGRGMVLWWNGYSDSQIPRIRLAFRNGRLSATRPDDEILGKMREIASRLGAILTSDEGTPIYTARRPTTGGVPNG